MRELTPQEIFEAEDPETMVPKLLAKGVPDEEIIERVVQLDWSPAAARVLLERIKSDLARYHASPESKQALVAEARKQTIRGLLLAVLGLFVGAFTLLVLRIGLLPFVVITGGMTLSGLGIAATGFSRWRVYRRNALPVPLAAEDETG